MDAVAYALASQALKALSNLPVVPVWRPAASMTTVRWGHAAAPLSGNRVLVVGGTNDGLAVLRTTERYDDTTGTWTIRADMATARIAHAAAPLSGDRVLIVGGGADERNYHRTVELYDDATNSWTSRASLSQVRSYAAAVSLSNDRVLLIGGRTSYTQIVAKVERYSDATNTWTTRASMSTPRSLPGAAALSGDRVLVAGGFHYSYSGGAEYLATTERYDDATNSWTQRASMAVSRHGLAAAPLSGDRVLVMGGSNAGGTVHSSCEIYDDSTNTWSQYATLNMSARRNYLAAAPLDGDHVLAIGGATGSNSGGLSSAEMFYANPTAQVVQALSAIQAWAATRP